MESGPTRATVGYDARRASAGVAQLAERQPSKLHVAGSIPVSRSIPSFVLSSTRSLFANDLGDLSRLPNRVL